jgi:peptidoglycan/LPS O-acetylase OafA/YrhL
LPQDVIVGRGDSTLPQGAAAGAKRRPALDGIRAIAFLGVLVGHLRLPGLRGGGLGVNVFFVLSGFLITGILLAEHERRGSVSLIHFYVRRAARLLPALFVLVATFTVYALTIQRAGAPSVHHMLTTTLAVAGYAGNWVRAFHGVDALPWFGHTWSLSIEEQFYVIWPLCLIAALRWRGARGVFDAALVGALLSLVVRIFLWHGAKSFDRIYNGTDTNADQLLIGCALAAALALWPVAVRRFCRFAWLPGAGTLVLLMRTATWTSFWRLTIGYTLIGLAAAAVIGYVWCEPDSILSRVLSLPALAGTGLISYGLYLWHFPILLAVEGHVHSLLLRSIVVTGLTFAAALLSWRLIEQPVQRFARARLAERRAGGLLRTATSPVTGAD